MRHLKVLLSSVSNLHFLVCVHPVHIAPAGGAVHRHVHRVAHLCEVLTRGQHAHVTLNPGQDDVTNLGMKIFCPFYFEGWDELEILKDLPLRTLGCLVLSRVTISGSAMVKQVLATGVRPRLWGRTRIRIDGKT